MRAGYHLTRLFLAASLTTLCMAQSPQKVGLDGRIVDAATDRLLPARIYIQNADGDWFFAVSSDPEGSAVEYRKERSPISVEMHTTLSAHPFRADLPPGEYEITVERGKEYLPFHARVQLKNDPISLRIALRRWIDMSQHGWYSGETHVHRDLGELPTAMLADDLNVALPLTYWVTKAYTPPSQGDKNSPPVKPEVITLDPLHVIYPMNTEYEIFTVDGKRHTLGAVFALNHRRVLPQGAPPVKSIAEQVHREGGLLELDKHNWPWSMMLVPVMKVDLYELTNNHIWRTAFHFRNFGEGVAPYMQVERSEDGMDEKGWIEFTFQNYYTLLNCGFRLRPTAGTASGVHPVPLGFGRVYVRLEDGFSYEAWMEGLNQGRSFVTTGPMLVTQLNDAWPGHAFEHDGEEARKFLLKGWARSAAPLSKIEVISAGQVIKTITPANRKESAGGYLSPIDASLDFSSSTWVTVRCYEPTADGRFRFAHSAPFFIDVPGKPLRPRREEVEYLIQRVKAEIERHTGVLPAAALGEYREALAVYEAIAEEAR